MKTEFEQSQHANLIGFQELANLLIWIGQRNEYVKRLNFPGYEEFAIGMIDVCNEKIKKILNL